LILLYLINFEEKKIGGMGTVSQLPLGQRKSFRGTHDARVLRVACFKG
jgi:hypothetical protein